MLKVYSMDNIEHYNNDFVLRQKSRNLKIEELETEWINSLVFEMFKTLYSDSSGIGLAAPQVGMLLNIVVIDIKRDAKKPLLLINPTYEPVDKELVISKETCLSVPYFSGEVERFRSVKVDAIDIKGNPIEIIGEKFLSFVFQHEIDHLNGILYIDRILDSSKLTSYSGYCNVMAVKAINALSKADIDGDK